MSHERGTLLIAWQESNLWPPEHRAGAWTAELRELIERKVILLSSYVWRPLSSLKKPKHTGKVLKNVDIHEESETHFTFYFVTQSLELIVQWIGEIRIPHFIQQLSFKTNVKFLIISFIWKTDVIIELLSSC